MGVEVQLFGPPRALVDGRPLEVDTRKAIALLALLAMSEAPVSRDVLAATLWPERDREHARGALRRTLSVLRAGVGGDALTVDRAVVGLVPDAADIDVVRFRSYMHSGDLDAAVEIPRGDFLEGFWLRDAPSFDDWQIATAESLRRELADALAALVDDRLSRGRAADAVDAAERLVALDPLQETWQRALMNAYATAGRRAEAIRQYRECVALLERELGVAPLPETTALFESVIEGRGAPAPRPHEPAPAAPEPPFVGRDDDLDAVLDAVDAAAEGGRFIVVEGEAGIGKTRLVDEAARIVRQAGRPVLVARAHEDEGGLSFNLVVEALRGALSADAEWVARLNDIDAAECGRLLPEILQQRPEVPAPAQLEGPGAQARLLAAIADALVAAVEHDRAGVLILDDLHWGDPSSIDAVSYLLRRVTERRVCVVATWRREALSAGHRLRRLLAESRRTGTAEIVKLGRLARADVAEMAAAVGLDDPTAERIYDESEGLPFFVVEHLAAYVSGAPDTGTVEAVLAARVGSLEELDGQILAAAAVIGRSFDPELVREAAGRGEEEAVVALEHLTARGLIREVDQDGRYDFVHERLRSFVLSHTALARRRLLHRRVAEALGRHAGAPDALIGLHYEHAGRSDDAARAYVAAGDAARSLFANQEAIEHYERAVALGAEDPATVHEALGDLTTLTGRYDHAVSHYDAAAELGAPLAVLEHKIGRVRNRLGEWDPARSHFRRAYDATEDQVLRAHILVDGSLAAHHAGDDASAEAHALEALDLAEQAGDAAATARAHNVLGILSADDADSARGHLEHALALSEELEDPAPAVAALNNLALVQRAEGLLEDALDLTEQALARCVRHGDRHRAAALHSNAADCLHALGRAGEAVDHLKIAARLFADVGDEELRPEIWKTVVW